MRHPEDDALLDHQQLAVNLVAHPGCPGADLQAFLATEELTLEALHSASLRIPVEVMTRLWRRARELTGNPAIGVAVAEFVGPTTFGTLTMALYAAPDLGTALKTLARYGSLFTDGAIWWIRREKQHADLFVLTRFDTADEVVDAAGATYLKILRDISTQKLVPMRVRLARVAPTDRTPWQNFFDCPLLFNTQLPTVMRFGAEGFDRRLFGYNAELFEYAINIMDAQLAGLKQGPITAHVRARIVVGLSEHAAGIEVIAQQLEMTPRSLQRKLKMEGRSFSDLVDNVRRELATRYLQHSVLPISEISHLIGYSNQSSFTRACERWYQQRPLDVRRCGHVCSPELRKS